jgi:hypothetical protein
VYIEVSIYRVNGAEGIGLTWSLMLQMEAPWPDVCLAVGVRMFSGKGPYD